LGLSAAILPRACGDDHGSRNYPEASQVGTLAFINLLLLSYGEQRERDSTRWQDHHRQPRDVDGDPLLKRRPNSVEKDKAGIADGLVLFWSQILAGIDAGLLFLRLRKG
jgi:hypothetical protein